MIHKVILVFLVRLSDFSFDCLRCLVLYSLSRRSSVTHFSFFSNPSH